MKYKDFYSYLLTENTSSNLESLRLSLTSMGVSNFIYERDGTIRISEIQVEKSKRKQGLGTRAMNLIIEYADKTNQLIVLSPDTSYGATSVERLRRFYKKFGFKDNRGGKKNYKYTETMIRYPNRSLNEEIDVKSVDKKYPLAKAYVDDREVLDNVDNTSSISSSLNNWTILKGIREVPMSDFRTTGRHYSVRGTNRIEQLANQIKESNSISPLIVVIDKDGPYILEGSTRVEALHLIKAKSFPAMVVIDLD